MMSMELISSLVVENKSKVVLLVADGLGGLPSGPGGKTALEHANTPNLDKLAGISSLGQADPISPGVTPGSGPAHMALFGYDPVKNMVERGALSAAGVDFPMEEGDIAVRANFSTIDSSGKITDRRAGRISSEKGVELCGLLDKKISIDGVEVFVKPEKEHRAAIIFRCKGLSDEVCDTDPQEVGVAPVEPEPTDGGSEESRRTAGIAAEFSKQASEILAGEEKANYIILRGLASKPSLPSMCDLYKLKCAAVATYPMYRGLARLVGMDVLETGTSVEDQIKTLAANWEKYTYFFFHVKGMDSGGEDGNFDKRVKIIEEVDAALPKLMKLKPDVLAVTGDHSTPAMLASHSWHPVPMLIHSEYVRHSGAASFGERECARGNLGRLASVNVLPIMLGNAKRLKKFGA
jgi:2,3-bisphosphoglycerate-independent phosphoglycerate mutase